MRVARRRRAERVYACGALQRFRAARSTRTLDRMTETSRKTPFFNSTHALKGADALATIFCFFAVTFATLDYVRFSQVRAVTFSWAVVAVALLVLIYLLSRRATSVIKPLIWGLAMSAVFLGVGWLARG